MGYNEKTTLRNAVVLLIWSGLGVAPGALAQEQRMASGGIEEVFVTAQKRTESINEVPVSITAATGEKLSNLGITDVGDLSKLVPGFTYTESALATPVFTLRGIGFYETSLGAKPTVAVYVDEVGLPFSILTRGAMLDLERVEVLKGPQGTLYGQSSTGGAINYIAAKPTDQLEYGVKIEYARFDASDIEGFVSGPITDSLKGRLAVKTQQGGAWQKSHTRSDKIGDKDFTAARLLLDWEPTETTRIQMNLNGYVDRSDEFVASLHAITPLGDINQVPELAHQPIAPRKNGAADWTPNPHPRRDHTFYNAAIRGDFDLNDRATLTSITSYSELDYDQKVDPDGTVLRAFFYNTIADMETFSQELRLAGEASERLRYIIGASYNYENVDQHDIQGPYPDSTSPHDVAESLGVDPWDSFDTFSYQKFRTSSVFGSFDYDITPQITGRFGFRYEESKIEFSGCTNDFDGNLAQGFTVLLNSIRPQFGLPADIAIPKGGCVTTDPATLIPEVVRRDLNEDNLSLRIGLDFNPSDELMIYGSINKGYKSGSFPLISANDANQFNPVTQESVIAYELGIKAALWDRRAQFNGAIFYYDYEDKQFRGRVIAEPDIFGPLEALVNVPKSSVTGIEGQLDMVPVDGLRISIGATYLDTEIRGGFVNYTSFGDLDNFSGEPFPLTPKWHVVSDVEYEWQIKSDLRAYVGVNASYRSDTNGSFGELPIFDIDEYALVDFRIGLRGDAKSMWSVNLFVQNAFDEYYYTNSARILDTTSRYTGMPRRYGVSFEYRM